MRLDTIWHLARKEILSTFRDRRALVSNIAIPLVLMPVMMLGMPLLLGGIFESETVNVTPVAVEGAGNLPGGLRDLMEASLLEIHEVGNAEAAVRDGDYDTGMTVPEGFAADLESGAGVSLTLHSLLSNMQSDLATSKLSLVLGVYGDQLVEARLADAGLDPAVLEPIRVVTQDASSEQARSSGMLGWMIPFFIALWGLIGGQMTAVDATAGEKERGTMESLLVSPVSRFEVVIGKWLATLLFGLMATGAAIAGYLLGTVLADNFMSASTADGEAFMQIMGGSLSLNLGGVLELLVSAVLLTGFIAALLIFVATFARSFKEAQSYLGPLSFVMVIPAVAMQFRDFFDLGFAQYVIPILNAIIVMYDTVRGATDPIGLVVTWVSLVVFTVVLLLLSHRSFRREDVIFRT